MYLQPQNIQGTTSSGYPMSVPRTSKHSRYNQLFLLNVYIYNLVQSTLATQLLCVQPPPTFQIQPALISQCLYLQPQNIQGTTSSGYPTSISTTSKHSRYNQLWIPNVYIYNLKTFKLQPALATQRLYLQAQDIQGTTTMATPTSIYNSIHSRYNQLWPSNVYIYNLKTFKVQPALATQRLYLQPQDIEGTINSGNPTSISTTSKHSRYSQLWQFNVYIYNLKTFKVQPALATQRLYISRTSKHSRYNHYGYPNLHLQLNSFKVQPTLATQRLYLHPQNIEGTINSGNPTSISTTSKHSRNSQLWLPNVYIYNLKTFKVQPLWLPQPPFLQLKTFKVQSDLTINVHIYKLKTFKVQRALAT
jgi:hypothetical protein